MKISGRTGTVLLAGLTVLFIGCSMKERKQISDDWRKEVEPVVQETVGTLRAISENSNILTAKIIDATNAVEKTTSVWWKTATSGIGGVVFWDFIKRRLKIVR